MKSTTFAGALAGFAVLCSAPPALAVPVTVDLRVEGPTRTLVEQRITVGVRPFEFSDEETEYTCDATGSTGSQPTPSPTRNGALAEAAQRGGLELTGSFGQFGPSFDRINGEAVAFDGGTKKYLVEYQNGAVDEDFGGCGRALADGDDVLYAYGTGSEPLLRLTGPATVKPGESAALAVTNVGDAQPVAGAAIAGKTTPADGRVTTAPLNQRGAVSFKATKDGAIRSNAVTVCVTDGADGFCGTTAPGAAPGPGTAPALLVRGPDTLAAFAKIGSITEGRRYPRGRGPRTLAGVVDAEPAGVRDVRLRLSRTRSGRCTRYDGERERLVTARCGIKNAPTFSVGDDARFSYLLPAALPTGRYVLDVIVIDRAGNRTTTYQRTRNRVVFHVA